RVELSGHEVAGTHPGSPGPFPERDPRPRSAGRGGKKLPPPETLLPAPGGPDAAGSIFTRSRASFTPRGLSGCASARARRIVAATSRFTTGTQYSGRRPYVASNRSRKRRPTGLLSSYWSTPIHPRSAFHMMVLSQAFWNAVPVNRGGFQPSASRAGPSRTP